ncbi:MAG: thiamine pyrophosphate-binding protein [Proteobacteria bacterium]|nr:thiamine pyrophosphate-binding protein [Burkholderiales bacterium]
MTHMTGAEAMVRMLEAHGVRHLFGLCGDTSLPFYDALARLDHGIAHILTRDERHAAYMADGYARVTGRVGVCEGPSGGGATYLLPGVVEANESSIPVLALNSDISVASKGRFTLTELDQKAMFRPLTKWNTVIPSAAKLPQSVREAFSQMTTGRPGAAHLALPFDVQKQTVDAAEVWGDPALGVFPARRQAADPDTISAAVTLLREADKPLLICGGGPVIAGAFDEVRRLAELLDAPVATSVSGKGILADTHRLALGVVGSNGGTTPTRDVVAAADLVLFIGCRAGSVTTEKWRHPAHGKQRIIHLDVDPATAGANYPLDVAIVGDARLALGQLGAALIGAGVRSRGGAASAAALRVASAKREKFEVFDALARADDTPIKPERIVATLNALLPVDSVVVADPGTPCPYFSAYYQLQESGRRYWSNRAHGALGYSLAAAVGAAVGRPSAKVVAVMGDGSFGMCCGELETIVRLKLPITLVVVSNATYGWIKAGQKSGFDARYFSVDFSRTDHAQVAAAFGVKSFSVSDPSKLRDTLRVALEAGEPTLVDVIAQPLHEANAPVSEWIA